jgi:oligopeptide transport system substrate-binding protein
VLQAQLGEVLGLTVHATPTEEKVYLDAERSKHYEVMLDSWAYPWNDPSAYYQTGQTGNPNNDSGWSDPAFDKAYSAAEETMDPKARARAFEEQEERLAQGVPYAPLFYPNSPNLVAPSVKGWLDNPGRIISWKALSLEP